MRSLDMLGKKKPGYIGKQEETRSLDRIGNKTPPVGRRGSVAGRSPVRRWSVAGWSPVAGPSPVTGRPPVAGNSSLIADSFAYTMLP
jgi:hypothetical protein